MRYADIFKIARHLVFSERLKISWWLLFVRTIKQGVKKMKCPMNAEHKEDLHDDGQGGLYCPECDLTFTAVKGKVSVENKKGKIQELEENNAYLQKEIEAIKTFLLGKGGDFFGLD